MDDMTREHYLALLSWFGPQTQGLGALLREYGTPQALLTANWQDIHAAEQLAAAPPATQRALGLARKHWPRRNSKAPSVNAVKAPSDIFIPFGDLHYPPSLRAAPDPPPWLFCRGDPACLLRPTVAVVGSRRASHAGLRGAELIAERLAAAGYTVCSGLALGIDGAAHRGALKAGCTSAVLASGIDRASPVRHRPLAEQITQTGCLVSELPAGTPPAKHQFPRRNRIISGLAQATIIVEAALPSGSLHTAAAALEQGRDVYALPWSIFHAQGAGCLRLLRDGATPITALADLASWFPGVAGQRNAPEQMPSGSAGEILQLLGDDGLSLQALVQSTGMLIPQLLALLSELEVQGWLTLSDGRYCRDNRKPCQSRTSC
ncbi:DNA-processing protein DprA [Congregibacter variabilis]|uniref:DNA-processing protein DprA n=1 Tax=Congregibacter variabilis TaxID=3081200 RepID=A0ABZ0HZ17_9GAMM|nr:DNA-processing protein DprA [Congregibacter sp. IMCC43200]